jgi:hypothetical protein
VCDSAAEATLEVLLLFGAGDADVIIDAVDSFLNGLVSSSPPSSSSFSFSTSFSTSTTSTGIGCSVTNTDLLSLVGEGRRKNELSLRLRRVVEVIFCKMPFTGSGELGPRSA